MLRGEKVVLRPVERADLKTLHAFRNDLEVHVLADDDPWVPRPFESFEKFFEERFKPTEPEAWFVIEVDGRTIGDCGLWDFDLTSRRCDLGIAIGERDSWGKGYGRDAVKVLVEYAFRHHNLVKVTLSTTSDNERAIRAYEAAGFQREGLLRRQVWSDGSYRDIVAMGVLRDDDGQPGQSP
jgi:RimJ/RimL family protein N-acetyltransferase